MTFAALMAQIVGQRILADPEMRAPWDSFVATGNSSVLSTICGKAESIPDTDIAALYYALVYQKSHYDAVLAVLRQAPASLRRRRDGRWLLIDFGAGPGTVLLALADHLQTARGHPLDVAYVHIDSSVSMRRLAEQYFHAAPAVAVGSDLWHVNSVDDTNNVEPWADGAGQALFAFSYVLCQPTVDRAAVDAFAALIARTMTTLAGRPAYILNVEPLLTRTRWPELVAALGRHHIALPAGDQPRLNMDVIYLTPTGEIRDKRSTN